jgi:hypothetical protein
VYRLVVGNRLLRRPRHRWVDNTEWILERWDVVMWTGLVESSCEFGIEPLGSIRYRETVECPNNWGSLE